MNFNSPHFFLHRDCLFILIVSIGLWYVFSQYDVFEFLYMTTRKYEHLELDEFIILSVTIPALFIVAKNNKKKLVFSKSYSSQQRNMQLSNLLADEPENKVLIDSNWVLHSSEAKQLIEKLGKERGTTGFSDEEASILLNWANNIRHNEHVLNMIEKNVIRVDVIENKIMLKQNI